MDSPALWTARLHGILSQRASMPKAARPLCQRASSWKQNEPRAKDQIKAELDEGYKAGKFKAPQKPGIVYMLSDSVYLFINNRIVHGPPHLMFYAPYATDKDIGSPPGGRDMPHLIRAGQPDAYIIVIPGK
jgi:hypothetical protein